MSNVVLPDGWKWGNGDWRKCPVCKQQIATHEYCVVSPKYTKYHEYCLDEAPIYQKALKKHNQKS